MPNNKYTKDLLAPLVAKSLSWAQVCRELGITPSTGAQTHVTRRAKFFNISTKHFTSQGWSKGKVLGPKKELDTYLKNGSKISSHNLKIRLIKEGVKKEECERCKNTKWQDQKIPLELDHINSDHYDNRLGNLQILCPNCHALKTKGM